VRCAEVDELDYHVSVLRAGRPVGGPAEIALGRDGLVVSQGWHRGVLLPRVARERGWDAETFLSQTCLKAGLPPDSWRNGDVAIQAFEAEEFGADPGE